MKPTEAEIKAIEDKIRASYTGKKAPKASTPAVEVPADQKPQSFSTRSSIDISKV